GGEGQDEGGRPIKSACFPSPPAFSFRAMETQRGFKLLNLFTGFFVAVLVVVPPLGSKLVAIGPLILPGGTLIFPLTFIINGVLTEVYGFARSRRLIWIGMGCQFFAALMFWLIGIWPEAPSEQKQDAY